MLPDREGRLNLQTIQLRAFAALADEGSYTRVAHQLSYTEPAINMQIKGLERAVGMPLVHREGKRVLLTPAGRRLLPMVHDILERNQALERTIRAMQPTSRLVIGTGRHTGVFVLLPLLAEYRRITGDEPELHFLPAAELASGLVSGRFDMLMAGISDAVLPRADRLRQGIVRVPWADVEMALVGQPSILMPRRRPAPGSSTTVFVPEYAVAFHERGAEVAAKHVPEPRVARLETAEAVKSAVINGLGVGVLPVDQVRTEIANGLLVAMSLRGVQSGHVHILHRRGDELKPPARRLISYLLSVGRERRRAAAPQTGSTAPTAGAVAFRRPVRAVRSPAGAVRGTR